MEQADFGKGSGDRLQSLGWSLTPGPGLGGPTLAAQMCFVDCARSSKTRIFVVRSGIITHKVLQGSGSYSPSIQLTLGQVQSQQLLHNALQSSCRQGNAELCYDYIFSSLYFIFLKKYLNLSSKINK